MLTTMIALTLSMAINCATIEETARKVMLIRQMETPISKLLAVSNTEPYRTMVLEAYKKTAYRSEVNQKREADKYANFWHMACLESKRSGSNDTNR